MMIIKPKSVVLGLYKKTHALVCSERAIKCLRHNFRFVCTFASYRLEFAQVRHCNGQMTCACRTHQVRGFVIYIRSWLVSNASRSYFMLYVYGDKKSSLLLTRNLLLSIRVQNILTLDIISFVMVQSSLYTHQQRIFERMQYHSYYM